MFVFVLARWWIGDLYLAMRLKSAGMGWDLGHQHYSIACVFVCVCKTWWIKGQDHDRVEVALLSSLCRLTFTGQLSQPSSSSSPSSPTVAPSPVAASRLSRSGSDSQAERETGTTVQHSVAAPQSTSAVTLALLLTVHFIEGRSFIRVAEL